MTKVVPGLWPKFFPTEANKVVDKSAVDFAQKYRRSAVYIPAYQRPIQTAYIEPLRRNLDAPPVCMLPGFDCSSFEFRRLMPYIEQHYETWAVDVIGWGFTDCSAFVDEPLLPLSPDVKKEHLYEFWQTQIKRPMCLLGVSLGGAMAVQFTLEHPEAVECLILLNAQGYIDGLGMMSKMPSMVTRFGVKALQSEALRRYATKMTYDGAEDLDLEQAMIINRLHTLLPGWVEMRMAFIRSDGFSLSQRVRNIEVPTLILWGKNDRVLDPSFAERFCTDIEGSRLKWMDCGHGGPLESPKELAVEILGYLSERKCGQLIM